MFKLILGRAGTGKTTAVLSRLTKAGQRRKQVLIVPEQQSHEAERALCRAGGDRVSLYGEVLSFSRPITGNRRGARRGQISGSPCHRYSVPWWLRTEAS